MKKPKTTPFDPNDEPHKFAYKMDQLPRVANHGRSSLYLAIKRGELVARKAGRSTLVLPEDLAAYLSSLPRSR